MEKEVLIRGKLREYPLFGTFYIDETSVFGSVTAADQPEIAKRITACVPPPSHPMYRSFISGYAREIIKQLAVRHGGKWILQKRIMPPFSGQPFGRLLKADTDTEYPVSISHSDDHVAVCIGTVRSVGIDIQNIFRLGGKGIMVAFSEKEQNLIESAVSTKRNRQTLFTWAWTVKEAFLKALGVGFRFGLRAVSIERLDFFGKRFDLTISDPLLSVLPSVSICPICYHYLYGRYVKTLMVF